MSRCLNWCCWVVLQLAALGHTERIGAFKISPSLASSLTTSTHRYPLPHVSQSGGRNDYHTSADGYISDDRAVFFFVEPCEISTHPFFRTPLDGKRD